MQQQRDLVPPVGMIPRLERTVMARLAPARRVRTGWRWITVASLALAAALAVLIFQPELRQQVQPESQFVASTVIVGDHLYIWLEPVEGINRETTR
ncbi:MAG: hypothetical protein C4524_09595 [Candidatus Zixiibacteriota bacterium]|nr:MAG: hypothetical protein C4524_09595 [candidate division Zixibacteria bacterium]